jgi:uncharacterized protein
MKKLFFLVVLLSGLFISTVNAQKSNVSNSLLWKVSGNGLNAPSYLAGTFHMMCAKDFQIKDKVKTALNGVEQLVFEINFGDNAEMAALQKMLQSDKTISSQLTPAKAKKLDSVLHLYNTNLKDVDLFTPAALYSLLGQKAIPCPMTEVKLYEVELMKLAIKSSKKISALETVNGQQEFVSQAYSLDDLVEVLSKGDEYAVLAAEMVKAFKMEDLQSLDLYVKDRNYMTAQQEMFMLTKRNHNWVKQMPEIMKDGSTMFAVGAGHLWGNDGVITLLRKNGYTVEPVIQ